MAERRQKSCTSNGAVKITRKKRYQLETENLSLKGLKEFLVIFKKATFQNIPIHVTEFFIEL